MGTLHTMEKPQVHMHFVRNGRTHVALLIAKMFKRPFTVEDMQSISPQFLNTKRASQSMNLLKKHGFLNKVAKDHWQITPSGIAHLYRTAQYNALARIDD